MKKKTKMNRAVTAAIGMVLLVSILLSGCTSYGYNYHKEEPETSVEGLSDADPLYVEAQQDEVKAEEPEEEEKPYLLKDLAPWNEYSTTDYGFYWLQIDCNDFTVETLKMFFDTYMADTPYDQAYVVDPEELTTCEAELTASVKDFATGIVWNNQPWTIGDGWGHPSINCYRNEIQDWRGQLWFPSHRYHVTVGEAVSSGDFAMQMTWLDTHLWFLDQNYYELSFGYETPETAVEKLKEVFELIGKPTSVYLRSPSTRYDESYENYEIILCWERDNYTIAWSVKDQGMWNDFNKATERIITFEPFTYISKGAWDIYKNDTTDVELIA